jgi:hypothetical protein
VSSQLLKVWDDWSDGCFYPIDDGTHKGFLGNPSDVAGAIESRCLVGLRGELRVPQVQHDSSISLSDPIRTGFVVPNSAGVGKNVYYILDDTGTASHIHKVKIVASSPNHTYTDRNAVSYATVEMGRPAKYKGNFFWGSISDETATIWELVTSADAVIGSDTITAGNANTAGGHLGIVGNQLARFNTASGVSLLTTGDSPRTGTWGSFFPVGDGSGAARGVFGLEGLTYALREEALYTFNNRGRSAPIFNADYQPGEIESESFDDITYWKGGIVYLLSGSAWWWRPGFDPIAIGPETTSGYYSSTAAPITPFAFNRTLRFDSIKGVGNFLWGSIRGQNEYIVCGVPRSRDNPLDL